MLANDNKDCLNVWFFNIFLKPETELAVACLRWSLHPLLIYMTSMKAIQAPVEYYEKMPITSKKIDKKNTLMSLERTILERKYMMQFCCCLSVTFCWALYFVQLTLCKFYDNFTEPRGLLCSFIERVHNGSCELFE